MDGVVWLLFQAGASVQLLEASPIRPLYQVRVFFFIFDILANLLRVLGGSTVGRSLCCHAFLVYSCVHANFCTVFWI